MHYTISYDISEDKLRNRVVKILARHGCRRLQKSIFLARDFSPTELEDLKAELVPIMKAKATASDSLLCFAIEQDLLRDNFWQPAHLPDDVLIQKTYKLLF